ncbi:MAG: molybdate ABC transporter substrate-binding protein [Proteobacteria bacterium]|nr:molybdate ABC transporter substrate-binding protein [Pseudomonadota bacterium]
MTIGETPTRPWRFLTALTAALVCGVGLAREAAPGSAALPEPTLTVFAAASLTDALDEVDRAFTRDTHIAVKTSYASSATLAKQIESGAGADVFLSADREWMDYLEKHGQIRAGTRRDLLGNALVLVAPADSSVQLKIAPGFALAAALGTGRLATGDPDSVPAGIYARAALTKLGVWDAVAPHLARAENVRAALAYVARGEAPLGIVYRTDALADKHVRIVDTFPEDSHPPVIYPVAVTLGGRPESARYLDFLHTEGARQIFARYGFKTPM